MSSITDLTVYVYMQADIDTFSAETYAICRQCSSQSACTYAQYDSSADSVDSQIDLELHCLHTTYGECRLWRGIV